MAPQGSEKTLTDEQAREIAHALLEAAVMSGRRIDLEDVVYDDDTSRTRTAGSSSMKTRTAWTAATRRRAMMTEPVVDVLTRMQQANQNIGVLLVELLNDNSGDQAQRLREIGQHLGSLSAECLARAAELDGRAVEPPTRVVINVHD